MYTPSPRTEVLQKLRHNLYSQFGSHINFFSLLFVFIVTVQLALEASYSTQLDTKAPPYGYLGYFAILPYSLNVFHICIHGNYIICHRSFILYTKCHVCACESLFDWHTFSACQLYLFTVYVHVHYVIKQIAFLCGKGNLFITYLDRSRTVPSVWTGQLIRSVYHWVLALPFNLCIYSLVPKNFVYTTCTQMFYWHLECEPVMMVCAARQKKKNNLPNSSLSHVLVLTSLWCFKFIYKL